MVVFLRRARHPELELGVASGFDVITILNVTAGAIWRNRRIQIAVLSLELLIAFLVSAQRFYAAR